MIKKTVYLLIALTAVVLTGCDKGDVNIEYVAFQEDADGKFGLIAPDGEVLFSDEFKKAPTIATEGRFWAMNGEGYYELYKTGKNPERIGSEYRYVSPFYHGRAIVAERDKHISIVDRSGETVVELAKIDNKYRPDYVTGMNEGHAIFAVDTLQGVINYKGEMIVKPTYYAIAPMHDGMIVALDRNYALSVDAPKPVKDSPKGYVSVINKYGEKVLKISSKRYPQCLRRVFGEYLPVASAKDSTFAWGILNLKGEEVVKPSVKNRLITEIQGDNYIYKSDEDLYGVKKLTGETVLEAKYGYLEFIGQGLVLTDLSTVAEESDASGEEGKIIDLETKQSIGRPVSFGTQFLPSSYKYAFVASGDNKWRIINAKGDRLEVKTTLANVVVNVGDETIMSDFIDIDKFLDNVGFSSTGVDSLSFNSSVSDVLARQARHYSSANKPKASDWLNSKDVYIFRNVDGQNVSETVGFPSSISHRTYRTETVYDYDYYYSYYSGWTPYWYSYNRQVPAGYAFSDVTPCTFEMKFDNYGVLRGKLKQFYNKLAKKFKGMGSVVDENSGGVVVRMDNGQEAVVYLDGHNVTAKWGQLSGSDKDISGRYAAKETIEIE